jgi:Ser/Thr protein kinase RdoA (MazF antagonist)
VASRLALKAKRRGTGFLGMIDFDDRAYGWNVVDIAYALLDLNKLDEWTLSACHRILI